MAATAIGVLPLPLATAAVLGAGALALALIDPVWGVCWVLLAVPAQDRVALPGGLNLVQAALLLAALSWGLWLLAQPERRIRLGPLVLPGAILLWLLALSSIVSPYSTTAGLKETVRWAGVLLVYASVATCVRSTRQAVAVAICALLAPCVEAVIGLQQFLTADGPPSFLIAGGRFARAYGTIGQPNSFAGYLNMAWPLAAGLLAGALLARGPRPILGRTGLAACGAATLVLLAALVASFSRGGWVGAVGGAAAMILLALWFPPPGRAAAPGTQRPLRLLVPALAVALFALLAGGAGLIPAVASGRLASITQNLRLFDVRSVEVTPDNFAVVERMAQMQAAWGMLQDHPLLGVGPGNYTAAYSSHALNPWYTSQGHAHNYYLHIAAEAGLPTLAAYLILLAVALRQGTRALRRPHNGLWWALSLGCCGMMCAAMAHNMFENLHVLYLPVQLGAAWGLLAAAEERDEPCVTW